MSMRRSGFLVIFAHIKQEGRNIYNNILRAFMMVRNILATFVTTKLLSRVLWNFMWSQNMKGKIYQCNECDDIFTYKSSVKYHMDAIHRGIQSKCQICGKTVSTMGLRSHMKTMHQSPGMAEYSCKICSFKTSISKSYLAKHIRTKHEGFKFKCQLCEAEFCRKESLQKHTKKCNFQESSPS